METIKEKTIKESLSKYLSDANDEGTESLDSLGSWLKRKWDESKHKRGNSGKFATSEKTIEKQDELDSESGPTRNPEDKKKRDAIEEGVAQELGYESVEEFRADKDNYNSFLQSLPGRMERA